MVACCRLKFFFEEDKPYTLIDIPRYEKNEKELFHFLKKRLHFTNGPYFH